MTTPPIIIAYYGTNLVGTGEDLYQGRKSWCFAIGGKNTTVAHRDLLSWLNENNFDRESYIAIPHKHEQGPPKAWIDFFDADEAMRFRLILGGKLCKIYKFEEDE